jgi:ATP-binding cassette subfamily D (ALD) protein 3
MAHVFSVLTRRGKPLSSVIVITLLFAVYKARKHFLASGHQGGNKNSPSATHAKDKQGKKVPQKVGVNSHFIEQMKRLLPICIPGIVLFGKECIQRLMTFCLLPWLGLFSKESGLLFILATVLIARTWLDIW